MSDAENSQILRYAHDLARLYRSAKEDRRELWHVRDRFSRLQATCLDLVRCLSLEDAALRVARAGVELLDLSSAAVYLDRGGALVLAGEFGEERFRRSAPLERQDVELLTDQPDVFEAPPWSSLVLPAAEGQFSGPISVVPLLGRRRPVGFLAGPGELLTFDEADREERWTISLLMGHSGVVLENFLLEERRSVGGRGEAQAARRPKPRRAAGGGGDDGDFQGLLGSCPSMRELFELLERLARVDSPVLITGETGTGKSMVARALHQLRGRPGLFVTLNCGAIPEHLVESELFGHEAGAFTGAVKRHRGKVEQAEGGTLFLDEVGELPLALQVKLLSFLEEGRFTPVGSETEVRADVHIVSATNRDLEAAIQANSFRSDLFFRLNVFHVEVPPLRRRGNDVVRLAQSLGRTVAERYGLPQPELDEAVQERLLSYSWPGNVRELRNVIEKAVILSGGGQISADVLPAPGSEGVSVPADAGTAAGEGGAFDEELSFSEAKQRMIERWEVAYIVDVLRRTRGNIAWAARMARVDKKNLHRKLKRYGIDARAHRRRAG